MAGSWLRQVACLPLQRAELDSGPVHVGFILEEGATEKIISETFFLLLQYHSTNVPCTYFIQLTLTLFKLSKWQCHCTKVSLSSLFNYVFIN